MMCITDINMQCFFFGHDSRMCKLYCDHLVGYPFSLSTAESKTNCCNLHSKRKLSNTSLFPTLKGILVGNSIILLCATYEGLQANIVRSVRTRGGQHGLFSRVPQNEDIFEKRVSRCGLVFLLVKKGMKIFVEKKNLFLGIPHPYKKINFSKKQFFTVFWTKRNTNPHRETLFKNFLILSHPTV